MEELLGSVEGRVFFVSWAFSLQVDYLEPFKISLQKQEQGIYSNGEEGHRGNVSLSQTFSGVGDLLSQDIVDHYNGNIILASINCV